ncbi:hypothetical protein BGW42_000421 [Actinomortierella wolfii]|nr:hypothetical protein BGW42_000421 [Actinomortierella wolfii]
MVPKPGFSVGEATVEEAKAVFYEWPRQQNWNPSRKGIELEQVFYKVDPQAFRVGRLSEPNGEGGTSSIVSILVAIRYSDKLGFISNNIVKDGYRGQGIGLYAFMEALKLYPKNAIIGLDSAVAQVENYKKSGFVHVVWNNCRLGSSVDGFLEAIPSKLPQVQALKQRVIDIQEAPLDELVRLDKLYAGFDRPKFVELWKAFHAGEDHRFGVAVLAEDGKSILGYGAVRPAVTAYRIGPLYASDQTVAAAILVALGERIAQAYKEHPLPDSDDLALRFEIDVPDVNELAFQLLKDDLKFEEMFKTVRMWAGPAPPSLEVSGLYGVCSLEGG